MAPGPVSGQVAILVPLTGKLAEIGKPMLRSAQLALSQPGSPALLVKDTGGTPDGAATAAREAIDAGARMILGPVTSAETSRVAALARPANIPVLAFTNDQAQSQPGVWPLGITLGQQIRRLEGAIQASGHEPIAALLPNTDLGRAMAEALTTTISALGLPSPVIRMHESGAAGVTAAVKELTDTLLPDQPPPFGSILLGATGNDLKLFAKAFADANLDRTKVQILGPAVWGDPASGSSALVGAWFASADPDARAAMIRDYMAAYKQPPHPLGDLANDAAAIARVLGAQGKMTAAGLTQAQGFTGVDGWFALLPDGQVRRGLAVFRVDRLKPTKIGAAPGAGG